MSKHHIHTRLRHMLAAAALLLAATTAATAQEQSNPALYKAAGITAAQTRAAKQGDVKAMADIAFDFQVAYRYSERPNPELLVQAEYWYRMAADKGGGKQMYELAMFYSDQNYPYSKVQDCLMQASAKGYASATHSIASGYRYGLYGFSDKRKSFEWYQKAQNQGFDCQLDIANCYLEGDLGAPQDIDKGLAIMARLAKGGDGQAKNKVEEYGYGPNDYDALIAGGYGKQSGNRTTAGVSLPKEQTFVFNSHFDGTPVDMVVATIDAEHHKVEVKISGPFGKKYSYIISSYEYDSDQDYLYLMTEDGKNFVVLIPHYKDGDCAMALRGPQGDDMLYGCTGKDKFRALVSGVITAIRQQAR